MFYIIFKVRYHSAKAPKLVCFINLWVWSVSAFHKTPSFLTASSQSHIICKIDFLKGRWKKESNSFLKAIIILHHFSKHKKKEPRMAPECYLYSINKILYTYIYLSNIQFLMLLVNNCSIILFSMDCIYKCILIPHFRQNFYGKPTPLYCDPILCHP